MTDDLIPTRQKLEAVDRSLPGKVTGRLRRAVMSMVWEALSLKDAALANGMAVHSLRQAFRRSHVMQAYLSELQVLRAGEKAKNIHRLAEIRDAADNMPAVNAVKVLELLDEQSRPAVAPGAGQAPVSIRIVNITAPSAPATQIIDVTPAPAEPEPAPLIEPLFPRIR